MRRSLPFAVALSATLFAAAPPAHAAKIADTQSGGPIALAGNAVVYLVFRQSDQAARLRLARPGHGSRLIFSQRLFRGYLGEPTTSTAAASARRVGFIAFQYRGDIESSDYRTVTELWTGRPTGPLKLVSTTRGRSGCGGGAGAVAVGDDALATIESACPSGARVVVRDYAGKGTPRTIAKAQRIKALAAAGHFVAWVQRDRRVNGHWTYSIVVYDRSRGRVAHRIPNGGWADHLSVQADGKVAGQSANVTAWYSADAQTRHDLPAGSLGPRLGADRLLFSGNLGSTGETSLALRDLSGNQTVVASFPARQFRPDSVLPNADFDGRHLAFIQQGCTTNELWMLDANGPAYRAAETDPACPVTVSGGTRRAVNGRVSVDVTCPKGCHGDAQLLARGEESGGKTFTTDPYTYLHFRPGTSSLVFTLTAAARRTLQRTGKIDATVDVHTFDLNGTAHDATAPVDVRP